jgi:hypothetical protein
VSALAEALVAAQADLPCTLGKDADGQIQSRTYRYLTLDKLIAETRPILQKHGIGITQWPSWIKRGEDGAIPALTTRVFHKDSDVSIREASYSLSLGQPIDGATVQSEAMEFTMPLYLTDKTMQGLGSAITYARRYAWQSVLGIAAEEDNDASLQPAAQPADEPPF